MKRNKDYHNEFLSYSEKLKAVDGVNPKYNKSKSEEKWVFTSSHPNALRVELTYYTDTDLSGEVSLYIEDVDTGYWHTEEQPKGLDFHLELATAALRGDVKVNKSPILKFEERCFKVGDTWYCVRKGNPTYGYIKKRTLSDR